MLVSRLLNTDILSRFELMSVLRGLRPNWATCSTDGLQGLWDPPKTLKPGRFLVPTTIVTLTTSSPSLAPTPGQIAPSVPQVTAPSVVTTPLLSSPASVAAPRPNDAPNEAVPTISVNEPVPPIIPNLPVIFPQDPPIDETPITFTISPVDAESPPEVVTLFPGLTAGIPIATIGAQTLWPGQAITIEGSTSRPEDPQSISEELQISMGLDGAIMILDGSTTITVKPPTAPSTAQAQNPELDPPISISQSRLTVLAFIFNSETFTIGGAFTNDLVVHEHTITPGGTILVDGTRLSLDAQVSAIVVGDTIRSTITLSSIEVLAHSAQSPSQQSVSALPSEAKVVVLGMRTITLRAGQTTVIGGGTRALPDGGKMVVGAMTIVLDADGTRVIVNGATVGLMQSTLATASESIGLDDLVAYATPSSDNFPGQSVQGQPTQTAASRAVMGYAVSYWSLLLVSFSSLALLYS